MPLDLNDNETKAAIQAEAEKIAAPLKEKNTQLMDELKDFKRKFDGFDPEEYKTLKARQQEGDDNKVKDAKEFRARIEAEYAPKIESERQAREAAEAKLNKYVIDSELSGALGAAGIKELLPAAKALLLSERKVELTDGGATVDGLPVKDFIQKWATSDGKYFVAAADNSGGGAQGSGGGGASMGKKASEMTDSEKAVFISEKGLDAWKNKLKEM